ncbi:MAG: hypothetical protein J5824_08465, partial [Lachnospiraceae bacterium]|nr:hypothetical protein [Lachnospiraceae bacterium]
MKKSILKSLFLLIICTAAIVIFGSAPEKARAVLRPNTYSMSLDVTITGEVCHELTNLDNITITVNGGDKLVRPLPAGTDISTWFMGSESPRPAGMVVTVAEDAAAGATSFKVNFSGTVYGASKDDIKMEVQNCYFDETESDWYATASVTLTGATPKYNIIRNFTAPSGYSLVNYSSIYLKDKVSGTPGWVLNG